MEPKMQKKERLKPLSLYGLDLKEALHAMLLVDPRKLNMEIGKAEERGCPEPRKSRKTSAIKKGELE
jgi:hypothetical protein